MSDISNARSKRAFLSTVFSLVNQIVTLICGIIVPRVLLRAFGSEVYGATTSIAQFLAFITLLEGGVAGVARAALYKPLAENNHKVTSEIICEIKRFFRTIAYILVVYVVCLAVSYKQVSGVNTLSWSTCFWLVIVISISSFAEYFIGISYTVLVISAQRTYVSEILNSFVKILNTLLVVFLVYLNSSVLLVKLASTFVFVLKPVLLWLYVKKNFKLNENIKTKTKHISNKWSGFAHHIAFFLQANTDIALLTVFGNLKMVAVYSIYSLLINQLRDFASAFMSGMEAMFGDMLAKKETELLHKNFNNYELLISLVATILFSIAAIMIIPFIRLYTSGINDANYIEPIFAVVLIMASYLYCLRFPYDSLIIAAGHFKQTQLAAYGEAFINLLISIILLKPLGLLGVALGTFVSTALRAVYYSVYLQCRILKRSIWLFIKRETINFGLFGTLYCLGSRIISSCLCENYIIWVCLAIVVSICVIAITTLVNYIFYRDDLKPIICKLTGMLRQRIGKLAD